MPNIFRDLHIPATALYLLVMPLVGLIVLSFLWAWEKYVKDNSNRVIFLVLNDPWGKNILSKEQKRTIIGAIVLSFIMIIIGINLRLLLAYRPQIFSFTQAIPGTVLLSIFIVVFLIGLAILIRELLKTRSMRGHVPAQTEKMYNYSLIMGIILAVYALYALISFSLTFFAGS